MSEIFKVVIGKGLGVATNEPMARFMALIANEDNFEERCRVAKRLIHKDQTHQEANIAAGTRA